LGLTNCVKLAEQLRADEIFQKVALLLLTIGSLDDKGHIIKNAGFSGYLARPIKESHFLKALLQITPRQKSSGDDNFITPFTFSERKDFEIAVSERQLRILLAEDNLVNQKVAVRMLERLGCVVDIAVDGKEAVTMWQQSAYDMIFMDCHMPILDGYQATEEIRSIEGGNNHTPIIALTANAFEGEAQICADVGMDGFIAKPVKITDLEVVIVEYSQTNK
jgi:CheY-like chemotaxis protein